MTQHATRHDTTQHATISLWTLAHHLSMARARYAESEQVMREAGGQYLPVAQTFAQMQEECRRWEEMLTEADEVEITLMGDTLMITGEVWE